MDVKVLDKSGPFEENQDFKKFWARSGLERLPRAEAVGQDIEKQLKLLNKSLKETNLLVAQMPKRPR